MSPTNSTSNSGNEHTPSAMDAAYSVMLMLSVFTVFEEVFGLAASVQSQLSLITGVLAGFIILNFLRVYANVHNFDVFAGLLSTKIDRKGHAKTQIHFLNNLGPRTQIIERTIRFALALFIVAATKIKVFDILTYWSVDVFNFFYRVDLNPCEYEMGFAYLRCLEASNTHLQTYLMFKQSIGYFVGFVLLLLMLLVWDIVVIISFRDKTKYRESYISLKRYFRTGVTSGGVRYIRTMKFFERLAGLAFGLLAIGYLTAGSVGFRDDFASAFVFGGSFFAYVATVVFGEVFRGDGTTTLLKQLLLAPTVILQYGRSAWTHRTDSG